METLPTIIICQKHQSEKILLQIKEALMAGQLEKIMFIKKQNQSHKAHPSSKLPANGYRREILQQKIQEIYQQIRKKIDELIYVERQAAPLDFAGKLKGMYRQQKYSEIIDLVMEKNNSAHYKLTEQSDISFILGNCFFKLKKYYEAIQYYKDQRQDQNLRQRANRMNNLATCLAQTHQNQQSLKVYNQTLKIYHEMPELDQSNLLFNVAALYKISGMWKEAESYFQKSLKQRQIKSPYNQKMLYETHVQLGKVQKEQKKYEQSIKNYLFSMNYCKKNEAINPIKALTELCLVYEKLEKWDQSLHHYEFLSDEYEERDMNQGYIYEKVAFIHQKLSNFNLSAKFLKKSLIEYRKEGNQRKMSDISSSLIAAQEYEKKERKRQNLMIQSRFGEYH